MKSDIEKLRNKYIKNPPEGMTPRDIRQNRRFLYLLISQPSRFHARLRAGLFRPGERRKRSFL